MAEALKEGDFVEMDYTGKVVDEGIIFDTTIESVAKEAKILDSNARYEPVRIRLGKKHVIEGLDRNLLGKELNRKYVFRIPAKEAFGEKNPKMIQLISTNKFRQQNINPMPGLQVNMDGVMGTVKAVSGGRTIVDFNHPLAGKELEYEVDVKRLVTDVNEKVDAVLKLVGIKIDSSIDGDKIAFRTESELPKDVQESVTKLVNESIPEIKSVSFELVTKKSEEKADSNNKI